MKPAERDNFMTWYEEHRGDTFDIQDELLKYCKTDVNILRKACLTFRQLFMDTTETIGGTYIDPFEQCINIASACNLVFRSKFLKPDIIGLIPSKAMKWLKYMSESKGIHIQHAQNGGEQEVGPYRVEGYADGTVY